MSGAAHVTSSEVARPSSVQLGVLLAVPAAVTVYAVAFHVSIAGLGLDSRAYPQGIIIVLLLLVLLQVFSEIRTWWRSQELTSILQIWLPWRRTILSMLATAGFLWGIAIIGFYEALALYGLLLLPLLGIRRPVTVIAFNAGLIAGVFLLFDLALGVRLPGGLLVG